MTKWPVIWIRTVGELRAFTDTAAKEGWRLIHILPEAHNTSSLAVGCTIDIYLTLGLTPQYAYQVLHPAGVDHHMLIRVNSLSHMVRYARRHTKRVIP